MNKNQEIIEENRDTLETVANADCSASWIAEELLESVEGDSSNRQTKTTENEPEAPEEPISTNTENGGIEDSIFAY